MFPAYFGAVVIKVVFDVVLGELFVENKAMEVGVRPFSVCRHESKKLWYDVEVPLLNGYLLREYKFQVALHFFILLVKTKKDFRRDADLILNGSVYFVC